jgi:hypothetical protein
MPYPDMPGYSVPGPSQEAAMAVRDRVPAMHMRIRAVLQSAYPQGLTRDQIAHRIGILPHKVGPRLSELHTATIRQIEQTGERRRGDSGVSMNVWRLIVDGDQ